MAAAETLPERLVRLAIQKQLLHRLLSTYRSHRGKKRAIVAVSHSLLVVCYYLLQRKCHFQDLGVNYFDQVNHEKLTRYFVKRLTRLGHKVTLEPCSAVA